MAMTSNGTVTSNFGGAGGVNRLTPSEPPTVRLPFPETAYRCGATYKVAGAFHGVTVFDDVGRKLATLEPGEEATFEAVKLRFLVWEFAARWRRR